jgi:hypothetical protein
MPPPKQPTEAPASAPPDQDMWAAMFDKMSQTLDENLKLTKSLIPRIEVIEAAKSRPASPVDPSMFAPPSQAPQSYVQPSQGPQSYVQPSPAPQSYAPQSVG